jgi:hypothetical protein
LLPLGAHAAYGTKVPEVRKAQLSFPAVVQVSPYAETEKIRRGNREQLEFAASNGENGSARKMIRSLTGEKS